MMASWPPLGRIFLILSCILIYLCARSTLINSYFKLLGLCFVIPHISWQISKIVRHYFAQITFISPVNKAVLITGCDSGFGQLAAKALDTYGFHVFAGCLQPKGLGAQRLYKTTSNRLRILNLDVTQPSDIEVAIKEIEESDLQLWAVINNAAITDWGPVEWDSDSRRIRKIFEVNLFGLIKITNSCLPLLRKTKGRIVNISSVFGRITVGGMVPYCMSKHAVRSYTDGLRREISHTGIKVICIEPLAYQTEMTKEERIPESLKSAWQMADDGTKEFYGKASQQELINDLKGFLRIASPNVSEVTEAIEEAATATSPSDFYRCYSLFHGLVIWLSEQLNEQFLDILLRRPFLRRIVHILALPALKGKV